MPLAHNTIQGPYHRTKIISEARSFDAPQECKDLIP